MFRVKDLQDFGAGLTFIVIGIIGLYFGRDYTFGTAARMGPGYFPMLLSAGLVVIGAFFALKSLVVEGPPIVFPHWRSCLLILPAIVLFGALIERLGLVPTTLICTFLAAFAHHESKVKESAILSVGLAAFVTLLFIYALGQPMTAFGGN